MRFLTLAYVLEMLHPCSYTKLAPDWNLLKGSRSLQGIVAHLLAPWHVHGKPAGSYINDWTSAALAAGLSGFIARHGNASARYLGEFGLAGRPLRCGEGTRTPAGECGSLTKTVSSPIWIRSRVWMHLRCIFPCSFSDQRRSLQHRGH